MIKQEIKTKESTDISKKAPNKSRRYKKGITVQLDPLLFNILSKYCKKVRANRNQVVIVAIVNFLMLSSQVSKEDKIKLNKLILEEDKRQKYNPNQIGDTEFENIDNLLERILREQRKYLESLRFIDFKIVIDEDSD